MTTNQEGRQAALRDSTSTAYGVAADWHALFDDAGISAGTFNERLLAWINSELSASYSNLVSAMQAYAEDAGYDGWEDMATLVLAMNGAETLLDGETQGLAFDFTDQSALIIDTGTPANNYDSTGIVSSGSLVGPSGKLTYTSPSNKLTLQSDGVMRYQAHNLYLNSAAPANQSITVVSGASYAVTITGTVSVTASGAATGTWTAGTNTFTAATTTLTLGSTSGSGTVHVRRTPSNDDYIETAGAAKYALPLEYDTSGNCLGLLVEEQRTNLATYSSDFSTSWTLTGVTQTPAAAVSPTGATTATKIVSTNTGSGTRAVFKGIAFGSTASRTMSIYFKAAEYGFAYVTHISGSSAANRYTVVIDLSDGSMTTTATSGTPTNTSYIVDDAGNGWYRLSVTADGTTSALENYLQFGPADSGTPTISTGNVQFAGDGTSGIYVWQAQAELGSFPTSPVVTYGSASTRNADNISIATSAFPWADNAAGSLYVHCTDKGGVAYTRPVGIHAGTATANGVEIASTGTVANANVNTDGTCTTAVPWVKDTTIKSAVAWNTNDMAHSANGTTVVTDNTVTNPSSLTTLGVGSYTTVASQWFTGNIKAIAYWPRRKTDAELQAETA